MKVVEINGIKLEIDERTARTIEQYKVGDKVKILVKQYGDSYKIYPGLIIGFANFTMMPSIEIMYVDKDRWESDAFHIVCLNAKTENYEIAPMSEIENILDKQSVIDKFDSSIAKRELELEDLKLKREYFVKRFSQAFEAPVNVEVA